MGSNHTGLGDEYGVNLGAWAGCSEYAFSIGYPAAGATPAAIKNL
jgi:hypothetical protein